MKYHVAWAILAVVTFAGHLVAGLYSEDFYFMPEYIWFASVVFSMLAIYSGAITATKTDPDKRGVAIASAVIGGIVLLGLMYSATSWLFMLPETDFNVMPS